MFVTVGEDAFGEDYVLKFCGGTYSGVLQGKLRVAVASDQVNLYMITRVCLRVKPLHCINCLNN